MDDPIALYIHWPFCLAKCPYCDFNSHVRDRIPQARFADALRRELTWEAARIGHRKLGSIFFGGGTPSLMDPGTVASLITDARRLFEADPEIEITLEANPTSVERGRLAAFRDAGVNRVSLGVQALNDEALRFLGREHSAAEAIVALEAARDIFPRASFDLITARPDQTVAEWRTELRRALGFGLDHLSLYQLTIEPGTRFATLYARGAIRLPEGETAAELYAATEEESARAGLLPYEISNHARPGQESRHNLAYWRYGDYVGVGPGAHGRLTLGDRVIATRRHRAPEPWAELVERDGHGSTEEEHLDPPTRAREALIMGLRLSQGIDPARFAHRTGMALANALEPGAVAAAIEAGYLTWSCERLTATLEGRMRLDALLGAIVR